MFPISNSIKASRIPLLTFAIIAANLAIFYYQVVHANTTLFIAQYALIPSTVSFTNIESLSNFITSMFLHGGLFHLLINMWFLWIFGGNVEDGLGKIRFLGIYFLSGIIGALTQYLLMPTSSIPLLGASAAISGILAAYVVMYPLSQIRTFVVFIFAISIINIPAIFFVFYWFFVQIALGVFSLPFSVQEGGVAFWAHIGGFVTGFILTKTLFNKPLFRSSTKIIEGEIIG